MASKGLGLEEALAHLITDITSSGLIGSQSKSALSVLLVLGARLVRRSHWGDEL